MPEFESGADLGFSRGVGGEFSKEKKSKFCRTFFRSTNLTFLDLPNHCKDPILTKFSAPQATFSKNRARKAILGSFWKILTKKSHFFGARSPSKLVYIGAQGAFRKF